jgi:hypothetical protein
LHLAKQEPKKAIFPLLGDGKIASLGFSAYEKCLCTGQKSKNPLELLFFGSCPVLRRNAKSGLCPAINPIIMTLTKIIGLNLAIAQETHSFAIAPLIDSRASSNTTHRLHSNSFPTNPNHELFDN